MTNPNQNNSRRRGAQPGNRNALKHGYYSRLFKSVELGALSKIPAADLSPEIDLVRLSVSRFLEALNSAPESVDVETRLSILRAIILSADSINSLVRTQAILSLAGGAADETSAQLTDSSQSDDAVPS